MTAPSIAATAGKSHASRYASLVGVVFTQKDGLQCLETQRADLIKGMRVMIVTPGGPGEPQSLIKAEVLGSSCNDNGTQTVSIDGGKPQTRYALKLLQNDQAAAFGFGIIVKHVVLKEKNGTVQARFGLEKKPAYFSQCTSKEGIHLSVWSGLPLKEKSRWHAYYHLGFEVEPSCTDKETGNP
ncbi:MAG: hypothetical protein HYX62_02720 [Gammaproteobacteria bacterium]|nr:hypothetical protein [Gammaproteobacteria bacterium]